MNNKLTNTKQHIVNILLKCAEHRMAFVFRGLPPDASINDLEEFKPSLSWTWPPNCPLWTSLPEDVSLPKEWKIHYRGVEPVESEIYVGLVLDLSKVNGTLTEQLCTVSAFKDLYPVPRGGESAREAAYDFHCMVDDAAKKWLGQVFSQDPQAVYAQLKHGDLHVRRAGLSVLQNLVRRGDDDAIDACHSICAAHPDQSFNVMARLCLHGDHRLIDAVEKKLDSADSSWWVNIGPFFPRVLQEHQDHVGLVTAVCKRLEHMNQAVRDAAVETLSKVVSPASDNQHAIAEICLRLTHSRAGTRQSALRVLTHVARRGNEQAIQAVRPLLQDRSLRQVRPAAESALGRLERAARRN